MDVHCPSYRRSHQPWKENIQHFKKWNSLTFSYFCGLFLPSWILTWIQGLDWIQVQSGYGSGSTTLVLSFGLRKIFVLCLCIQISLFSHFKISFFYRCVHPWASVQPARLLGPFGSWRAFHIQPVHKSIIVIARYFGKLDPEPHLSEIM
jgi:hypothetical protein